MPMLCMFSVTNHAALRQHSIKRCAKHWSTNDAPRAAGCLLYAYRGLLARSAFRTLWVSCGTRMDNVSSSEAFYSEHELLESER